MQEERAMEPITKEIDVFVDGSCADNGRPTAEGGWACFATLPKTTEIITGTTQIGKLRHGKQTNNRAELEAVYQGLLWVDAQPDNGTIYTIWSDSEVAVNGINGASGRNANRDIWEDIESLCKKLVKEKKILFDGVKYVEGHKVDSPEPRHINNCTCDKFAKQGANSLLLEPYNPKGSVVNG